MLVMQKKIDSLVSAASVVNGNNSPVCLESISSSDLACDSMAAGISIGTHGNTEKWSSSSTVVKVPSATPVLSFTETLVKDIDKWEIAGGRNSSRP